MQGKIIKKTNTGIEILNGIYNKNHKYWADKKVYESGIDVIIEEYNNIDIETDISNKNELEEFIDNVKKTDLIKIFQTVTLIVKFKTFIYTNLNCTIMRHGKEYLNSKKDLIQNEYFTVIYNT